MNDRKDSIVIAGPEQFWRVATRRRFLQLLGLGGSIVLLPSVFSACSDNGSGPTPPPPPPPPPPGGAVVLNLSNDVGILNYAFALEQLEAAFYTAVLASAAYGGMTAEQKEVLTDLHDHEIVHREFLRAAIPDANRIGDLSVNTVTVTTATASAAAILKTAEQFEDLGVAAYNGAGKYLTSAANLAVAGKIVSVEARHAAAIRDLREGGGLTGTPAYTRFAGDDVVNAQGLDVKLEPSAVLARVGATNFIATTTPVSIGTGPTGTATPDAGPPDPTP